MPKLVNRLPAYRLHKASGLAFVALDGRRIYLGTHGSAESQRAYDRLLAEWLANGRRSATPGPGLTTPPALTVEDLLARYWNWAEGYYVKDGRQTSEVGAIRQALRPVSRLYGDTPASEFGPLALRAVREEMIRADMCRRTINSHVDRVRRAFKWSVAEALVPPGIYQALAAVPGLRRGRCSARESEPIRPVPEPDIEAVVPHVSEQVATMIRLQLLTGMRPGEVTIMRVCDLDTRWAVWTYGPSSHKTQHHEKERIVYLGPKAQEVVRPYLRPSPTAFLFDPSDAEARRNADRRVARKTPLWPSHRRALEKRKRGRPAAHFGPSPYTEAAYRRAIARACTKAGVPHWTPHRLRHNAATRLRRELGLEAARVVLGHGSAKVTEVYAEMDRSKALDAMQRLG